jgi:hypothetical protein
VVKFFLVIATIADLALAALLVSVSGFLFGSGPESIHAGAMAAAGYAVIVITCLAAPVAGFVLNARGKPGVGLAAAWLPIAGALVTMMTPVPY